MLPQQCLPFFEQDSNNLTKAPGPKNEYSNSYILFGGGRFVDEFRRDWELRRRIWEEFTGRIGECLYV